MNDSQTRIKQTAIVYSFQYLDSVAHQLTFPPQLLTQMPDLQERCQAKLKLRVESNLRTELIVQANRVRNLFPRQDVR
jgi:hypothetical protein